MATIIHETNSNDADISSSEGSDFDDSDDSDLSDSSETGDSDNESDKKSTLSCTTGMSGSTVKSVRKTTDMIVKQLEESLKIIDVIEERKMEKPLENAMLRDFISVSYQSASPFGSNKFRVNHSFKEKVEKIGIVVKDYYTFGEFSEFLTDYILSRNLTNEKGVINPDKFLTSLLEIENSPCTFIRLMGAARKVFV
jgi:hypothetical protein